VFIVAADVVKEMRRRRRRSPMCLWSIDDERACAELNSKLFPRLSSMAAHIKATPFKRAPRFSQSRSTLDPTTHSTLDPTTHSTLHPTTHSTLNSTLNSTLHSTLHPTTHSTLNSTIHSTLNNDPFQKRPISTKSAARKSSKACKKTKVPHPKAAKSAKPKGRER